MKLFNKIILYCIPIILFFIPFLWLKPGYIDIGGDAGRLYFYDPLHYLEKVSLYVLSPEGIGVEYSYQFTFPFVFFLLIAKIFIHSPYLLITLFNSFSLLIGYLSIYRIIFEIIEKLHKDIKNTTKLKLACMIAGIFYIFSPFATGGGWDKALLDHAQFFLNPLIFYLILRYIHYQNKIYLLIVLLISFIFSPNFSYSSIPKFVSFYSTSLIFLGIYAWKIVNLKPKIYEIFLFTVLFLCIHLFHIIPWIFNLFNQDSSIFLKVFTASSRQDALNFFNSIAYSVKLSANLLGVPAQPTEYGPVDILFIFIPLLITFASILNTSRKNSRKLQQLFLTTLIFYLIVLFFSTAKITGFFYKFYTYLFYIPGFSMFRSYVGQWSHTNLFFNALLLGISVYYFISLLPKRISRIVIFLLLLIFIIEAKSFIAGDMTNKIIAKKNSVEVRVPTIFDPEYEKLLNYIRKDPIDGKYLTFPIVDHFYQILAGKTGGAYIGPSTISYLTDKKDFGSSQILSIFSDIFLESAKVNNIKNIENIFSLLNIGTVFYNADPYILENFIAFPYQQTHQFLPANQIEYAKFIEKLPIDPLISVNNKYTLYRVKKEIYLPHFYIANSITAYPNYNNNAISQIVKYIVTNTQVNKDRRVAYLDESSYKSLYPLSEHIPSIQFRKLNATQYEINVTGATDPFLLIFLEAYDSDWRLSIKPINTKLFKSISYFNGQVKEGGHSNTFFSLFPTILSRNRFIPNIKHIQVNGYANGWYITPENTNSDSYTLVLTHASQIRFIYAFIFSLCSVFACLIWMIMLLLIRKFNKK